MPRGAWRWITSAIPWWTGFASRKRASEFFSEHRLNVSHCTVSLLPGSRTKELRFHLPIMLQTARWMHWQRPIQFLVPLSSPRHRPLIERIVAQEGGPSALRLIEQDTYNAVGHSDLAVVSSGTATLETALLETPLITVFKISNLTWIVGQYLVRVPFYSLVNLIAGRKWFPSFSRTTSRSSDFTAK